MSELQLHNERLLALLSVLVSTVNLCISCATLAGENFHFSQFSETDATKCRIMETDRQRVPHIRASNREGPTTKST